MSACEITRHVACRFSEDRLEHATNVIEEAQATARAAIAKATGP